MPEPDDGTAERHDELLARVSRSVAGVTPAPGGLERVRDALSQRRRRRRVRVGVASLAAAVVVAGVGAVVLPGVVGDDAQEPTGEPSVPSAVEAGLYRPAGFFADIVGGQSAPSITRFYRTVPRVDFTARFEWTPDPAGDAFLADITLERYRGSAEKRCDALVAGAALCDVGADGSVVARYELPADQAFLAPIVGEGRLRLPGSTGTLRGVTVFRTDAKAVTVLVCNCSSVGGAVLSESPPVTFEALEEVASDESWGLPVGS